MDCKEGKEINPKSGKCVKICKSGSERNPNTGRCKKVSYVRVPRPIPGPENRPKSALKFCKDGFERSKKSGKCVKICKSGNERNPKTGRCKKVSGTKNKPIPDPQVPSTPVLQVSPQVPSKSASRVPSKSVSPTVEDNDCKISNREIDSFFSKSVRDCIEELFCSKGKKFHKIFEDRRLPGESNCQALTRLIFPESVKKITKLLGKGVEGSVFASIGPNGEQNAVKISTRQSDLDFEREVRILKKTNLLDISVPVLETSTIVIPDSGKENHKFIIMDRIDGTAENLFNERKWSEEQLQIWVDEIFQIIKKLSDNNLVHGDMHLNNIGFKRQEDGSIKFMLLDFGFGEETSLPQADVLQVIKIVPFFIREDNQDNLDKLIRKNAFEMFGMINDTSKFQYEKVYLPGPVYEKNDENKIMVRQGVVFDEDWAVGKIEYRHFKLMDEVREARMELEKEQGLNK